MENILNTSSLDFVFVHHLNNNGIQSYRFHDVIIIQIDIAWSSYLVWVKCRSMEY